MITALQLVQQMTAETGLNVPSALASNTAQDVVQLMALTNAVGYELQREYEWQALVKQYIFNTSAITLTGDTTAAGSNITNASSIAGVDSTYGVYGTGLNQGTYVSGTPSGSTIPLNQPATRTATGSTFTLTKLKYAMPADYDRQIDRTHWDKGRHWEMLGPCTAQQWEWLLSGYISTGPRIRYRIFGSYLQVWPAPSTTSVLGFEYFSNAWAASAAGAAKSSFTADTDTCIFPDRLMVLGLKHKYFQIKGLGDVFKADYDSELSKAKSMDGGAQTLSFAPSVAGVLLSSDNLPDSGYGQ